MPILQRSAKKILKYKNLVIFHRVMEMKSILKLCFNINKINTCIDFVSLVNFIGNKI
jgi:hypothetical protein